MQMGEAPNCKGWFGVGPADMQYATLKYRLVLSLGSVYRQMESGPGSGLKVSSGCITKSFKQQPKETETGTKLRSNIISKLVNLDLILSLLR